ncbi:MAG: FHA domain-containing protein [Myxococcota bacterium]
MIRLTAVIEIEGQAPRALAHESSARSIIMGRDPSADFQIPLSTISRQHARIFENDNVYVIQDLGSTHGTLVNGKSIGKNAKKVLRDGDVIELTKAKITCNIEDQPQLEAAPGEGTKAIAARAVEGILGRLGEARSEGPYFRVLNGADEGMRVPLSSNLSEWSMGRSKDCEIVLNDANVSLRHALVKRDWQGFTIEDLGSKNGVIVNDHNIKKPRRLKDRDEITIGPVKLVFIDPDADLLSALKDVPGFQIEESQEIEDLDEDASMMGAPMEEGEAGPDGFGLDGDDEPSMLGGDDLGVEPLEPDDEPMDDIDPALLEPPATGRSAIEWVMIAVVGMLLLGAGLLLFVLMS